MRSGHVGHGQPWLAWVCAVFSLLLGQHAYAQAPVVCVGFDDVELFARIRGQTQDLPVHLVHAPEQPLPGASAQHFRQIASEHSAELVVAVQQVQGAARAVYIFDAAAGELRVRSAPAPSRRDRIGRSAASETIAVIVRGELSDLLASRAAATRAPPVSPTTEAVRTQPPAPTGAPAASTSGTAANRREGAGGSAQNANAKPAAPSAELPARPGAAPVSTENADTATSAALVTPATPQPEVEDTGDEAAAEPSSTPPTPGALRFALELDARAASPGSRRLFVGAGVGLYGFFGVFSLAIVGSASLPSRATHAGLELMLQQYGVGLEALGHVQLVPAWTLGLGAAARWSFFRRKTTARDTAELIPAPTAVSGSAVLGPLLELRWRPNAHFGLALRTGVDVLLRPLSLRYRTESNASVPEELERLRGWEPWGALGVFFTF